MSSCRRGPHKPVFLHALSKLERAGSRQAGRRTMILQVQERFCSTAHPSVATPSIPWHHPCQACIKIVISRPGPMLLNMLEALCRPCELHFRNGHRISCLHIRADNIGSISMDFLCLGSLEFGYCESFGHIWVDLGFLLRTCCSLLLYFPLSLNAYI